MNADLLIMTQTPRKDIELENDFSALVWRADITQCTVH